MLGFRPLATEAITESPPPSLISFFGAYGLTGQDVSLLFVRKVSVETGAYILSGEEIDFVVSLSPAALDRTLLVGSTASLYSGFRMIQNFTMTSGDTKTLVVTVKDADGDAVNIAGSTIRWQATRSLGRTATISKSTSSGITITDGAGGIFTVALDPDDTEGISGNFLHEAEIVFSGGTIATVLHGTMKVNNRLIANAT